MDSWSQKGPLWPFSHFLAGFRPNSRDFLVEKLEKFSKERRKMAIIGQFLAQKIAKNIFKTSIARKVTEIEL